MIMLPPLPFEPPPSQPRKAPELGRRWPWVSRRRAAAVIWSLKTAHSHELDGMIDYFSERETFLRQEIEFLRKKSEKSPATVPMQAARTSATERTG